jgi:hypothetical protein
MFKTIIVPLDGTAQAAAALPLARTLALRGIITGAPVDVATVIGLLNFGAVCFAPLTWFMRTRTI